MLGNPFELFYRHFKSFTNEFSEENFIGNFQFGKVYRGIWKDGVGKDFGRKKGEDMEVVVKLWEDPLIYEVCPGDTKERLRDEIRLCYLMRRDQHPNVATMIAYKTFRDFCACIYDIKPLDTLHNLIPKESFTWLQRTKVAFGLASALDYMHFFLDLSYNFERQIPYLIRNLGAAHIMIDKDHNPVLFDFSMISGGKVTDRKDLLNQYVHGCYGYIDPSLAQCGWSEKSDVFAYGVVLLGLIMKTVYTDEDRKNHLPFVYELAHDKLKSELSSSLVHQSLEEEHFFNPMDGILLTKLAMQCVDHDPQKRPSMKQVVKSLRELCIFIHHSDSFRVNELIKSEYKEKNKELSELFHSLFPYKQILDKRPSRQTITVAGKGCDMVHSFEDLRSYTNGFSEENLIGNFQFGKVYLGEMEGRKVTVKIWDDVYNRHTARVFDSEMELLQRDELVLLRHPKLMSHPNLVNLIGYCHEDKHIGALYDLKPLNTLHNLLLKDAFTWSQRIKVALEFARLVQFLHAFDPPYLICNCSATNIMLDQDYNAKLFDFGMFTGGILHNSRDRWGLHNNGHVALHRDQPVGCDAYSGGFDDTGDRWCEELDVFSFGVLLVALIAKKVTGKEELERGDPYLHKWVQSEYEAKMSIPGFDKSKFSIVHESLEQDPAFRSSDGVALTKLAMQCFVRWENQRPTMKQVLRMFSKLKIVGKTCAPENVLALTNT